MFISKLFNRFLITSILSVSTLFNSFADETLRTQKTEPSGFEWAEVVFRSNGKAFVGVTSKSGDWIIPLGNQIVFFEEATIRGNYYGFFYVQTKKSEEWTAALYSPNGDELVGFGRYIKFFWFDGKIVGSGPTNYETINISLDKLALEQHTQSATKGKDLCPFVEGKHYTITSMFTDKEIVLSGSTNYLVKNGNTIKLVFSKYPDLNFTMTSDFKAKNGINPNAAVYCNVTGGPFNKSGSLLITFHDNGMLTLSPMDLDDPRDFTIKR